MADLLALSRAEQQHSKLYWRWRLISHLATLAVATGALFADNPAAAVLAVVAVLTELAAWGCGRRSKTLHSLAERARRRALVTKSVAPDSRPVDAALIEIEMSARARRTADAWDDPNYYSSTAAPGPGAFRHDLQESAFWSGRLYGLAARASFLRLAAFGVAAITILSLLLVLDSGSAGETVARVLTLVMATLVSADELGVALAYRDAARLAETTVERASALDPEDLSALLNVFGDYACATESAPPISTKLYEKHHDQIEGAWSRATQSGQS